jgi:signal transduction histidine kinase/CheY-like chemotaxis protein
MISPSSNGPLNWLKAEHAWKGEKALVPVDTCYRILNQVAWVFAAVNLYTLAITFSQVFEPLKLNPAYWAFCATHLCMVPVAIFKGWPFDLRFRLLIADIFVTLAIVGIAVGIPPSWAFIVILLVALVSLFYGVKAGTMTIAAILLLHLVIAWGWVTDRLPVFLSRRTGIELLDLASSRTWARVIVVSGGYLAIVVALMRNVLGNLNSALGTATSTLRQLSIEQEHRARAEEARTLAERSAREAQKFEALGRLAGGVAHDFNNALCVMKCWSSYLLEVSTDEEVRNAMLEIKRSTENAEHLTQHLLAFSRSEKGKLEVSDLAEVVSHECRTLRRLLPKNIVVTEQVEGPIHVPLGKGQMQEIILNLAINARDAMPDGGSLLVQAGIESLEVPTKVLPTGRYARLTVSDTGIGMDEATVARVYEPFFTTKPEGKGTGLGLSMVYGLVSGAGGSISIRSEPGKGSVFTILLPQAKAEAHHREDRLAPGVTPMRCRALVVDSKPEIGSLIERILTRDGFPTLWVKSAASAVEALDSREDPVGVLVIQGTTPGLSTLEIIARARGKNPGCRVVIVSAPAMDPGLLDAVNEGHYHLLSKPFEAERLRAVVAAALTAEPGKPQGLEFTG